MNIYRLLSTFFIITLTACRSQGSANQVDSYEEIFSNADINQTITISAPSGLNTFRLNDGYVMISVLLESDHSVIFDVNDFKIYLNQENRWVQVPYQSPHKGMRYIIEPNEVPALRSAEISVIPNLEKVSVPVMLRIVVVGNIYDNEVLGDPVYAYIDVTLHP
jgi:hypothetical protein